MTNAEAWFNNSLRPRKPEGSLGRTAQDGHLDSHTAPELCTQHTTFNTLDNWGHKTPTQSKRKRTRKKRLKVMARNMYTIHSVTERKLLCQLFTATNCSTIAAHGRPGTLAKKLHDSFNLCIYNNHNHNNHNNYKGGAVWVQKKKKKEKKRRVIMTSFLVFNILQA